MRIVVTGGCGFVGAPLVSRLLARSHAVTVIDNFANAAPERLPRHPHLRVQRIDVRSGPDMTEAFRACLPDAIYHLAALHFIPYCEAHPQETLDVNFAGTVQTLRAAIAVGAPRFVMVSTAAVYPPSDEGCREDLLAGPVDIYGYSKWAAELALGQACHDSTLSGVIVRLFNVFGPGETNPHVIPRIIEQLHAGDVLRLGNIDSERDYIFTSDVAEGLERLLELAARTPQVFNLGSGRAISVRVLLSLIEGILGRPLEVTTDPGLVRPNDRRRLQADLTRLCKAMGWSPKVDLDAGLRELLRVEGIRGTHG